MATQNSRYEIVFNEDLPTLLWSLEATLYRVPNAKFNRLRYISSFYAPVSLLQKKQWK